MPKAFFPALVALVTVAAFGCKSGSDDKGGGSETTVASEPGTQSPSDNAGADGGEDLGVDVLVPMGLWNPEAFTPAIRKLPTTITGQAVGEDPAFSNHAVNLGTDSFLPKTDDPIAFEKAALHTPRRLTAGMKDLLQTLRGLMQSMFGAKGTYRGTEIKIETKDGKGSFTIDLLDKTSAETAERKSFSVFTYDESNKAYPFALEVWGQTAKGADDFVIVTKWMFKENPTSNKLDTRVELYTQSGTKSVFGEIEFSDGADSLLVRTMSDPAVPGEGIRSQIRYRFSETANDVQGVYVLAGAAQTAGVYNPRYRDLHTGDLHLFHVYNDSAVTDDAIQELAFIPVESITANPNFTNSTYATDSYFPHGLKNLAGFVRDPDIYSACATGKADFQTKLTDAGKPIPTSLSSAPASLCADSATEEQVNNIIYDVCYVSLAAAEPFTIDAKPNDSLVSVDLCSQLSLVTYLSNPQRLYVDAGVVYAQFFDATPPSLDAFRARGPLNATQQLLYDAMKTTTFEEYSTLINATIPVLEHRKAAAFKVDANLVYPP